MSCLRHFQETVCANKVGHRNYALTYIVAQILDKNVVMKNTYVWQKAKSSHVNSFGYGWQSDRVVRCHVRIEVKWKFPGNGASPTHTQAYKCRRWCTRAGALDTVAKQIATNCAMPPPYLSLTNTHPPPPPPDNGVSTISAAIGPLLFPPNPLFFSFLPFSFFSSPSPFPSPSSFCSF